MSKPLRTIWLKVHCWLGLVAGFLFVLTGLSGSFLVYHRAIDEWMHPQLLQSSETGPRRPVDEVLTAARAAYWQGQSRNQRQNAAFVDVPRTDQGVWTVWFSSGGEPHPQFTHVYVDPVTAKVTGRRIWGAYLMSWIYRFHDRLLAGGVGHTLVGLSGLLLILSLGTGIFLWWPLWRNSYRAAFSIRRGRRFLYDLHKVAGILAAAVLFLIAFSGVYLVFPHWVRPTVQLISPSASTGASDPHSTPLPGSAPIAIERVAAIAREVFPEAELKRIYLPTAPEDPVVVRIRRRGEVRRSSGNSRVWIDQYSGEVLKVRDWHTYSAGDTFLAWQFPLHNGEAFGQAGRASVFLAGCAPLVLYVTGCMLWWRKRTARRRQARTARRAVRVEVTDAA